MTKNYIVHAVAWDGTTLSESLKRQKNINFVPTAVLRWMRLSTGEKERNRMKILNEVAIWFVVATIIIDYYNNTVSIAELIIRIFLIGLNAICYAMLNEE